jgi:HEAT repeat protein
MPPPQTPAPPPSTAAPKPVLPPGWKWLMRITFAVTMLLFLLPAVYVVKYYAVDRPREQELAKMLNVSPLAALPAVDYLPAQEQRARDPHSDARVAAIQTIGAILRQPGITYRRPLECLSAKATLADLATKDANPAVRSAASEELGRVAQGGAVIRR